MRCPAPLRTLALRDLHSRSGNPKWGHETPWRIQKSFRMSSSSEVQTFIDGPVPVELRPAIDEYCRWERAHVDSEQSRAQVSVPLYHYTGLNALRGIIETESIWCTDYRHMNDQSELSYGVEVAKDALARLAIQADARVCLFCQCVDGLLDITHFNGNLDFYTASFTAQRDDPDQWERYGDKGRGVAIGLSPSMFGIIDAAGLQPHEMSFVGPVLYDRAAIFARHDAAIRAAATIFKAAADRHPNIMAHKANGLPFMDRLAKELIASPLIWNCITSKEHALWATEREIRLIVMGQTKNLAPYVQYRQRAAERIPYIAHPFWVRAPDALHEIVIGPEAGDEAEAEVAQMLCDFGVGGVRVARSK